MQCIEISLGLVEVLPSRRDVLALLELPRDVGPALQQLRVREPSLESIAVRIAVVRDARSWLQSLSEHLDRQEVQRIDEHVCRAQMHFRAGLHLLAHQVHEGREGRGELITLSIVS